MKKQILLLFAVLLTILPAMSQSYDFSAAAPSGQMLYYKINGSNVTLTYPGPAGGDDAWYEFTKPTGALTIPGSVTYNGTTYTVTAISDYTFYECYRLTSVAVPSNVTSIGRSAFAFCYDLTVVNIPNGVTTINEYCFTTCRNITSITIPSSVTSIKFDAFYNCTGVASITIPDGVTSIGSEAFYNVRNIDYNGSATGTPWGALSVNGTRVVNYDFSEDTPSGQTLYYKIDGINAMVTYPSVSGSSQAWSGFSQPTGDLTIPGSVTYNGTTYNVTAIDDYTFYECYRLTSVAVPSNVTSIGRSAFAFCYDLTAVNIPNGVTTVNDYCFTTCHNITSITIPSSVTSIKYSAFYNCTGVVSITIPDGVTSISSNAFYNVRNINYNGSASGSPWGALSVNGVRIITYDFSEIAPSGQTLYYKIDGINAMVTYPSVSGSSQAWSGFSQPTGDLTIPGSVTYNGTTYNVTAIDDYTFYECYRLTSVAVPSNVTSIGRSAFAFCYDLTAVNIPNGVTTVNEYCFTTCRNITSITIPSSVTSIKYNAFYNCAGLQEMIVRADNPPSIGSNALYHISSSTPIYVPCGRSSVYAASSDWDRFSNFAERPIYDVTALSADNIMGTATVQTQPTCQSSTATVLATPDCGYRFVRWTNGGVEVSTDATYSFTVTSDITLTAEFEALDNVQINGLWYTLDCANHTATVVTENVYYPFYTTTLSGNVVIPGSVVYDGNTYTVTAVGNNVFSFSRVTSITIPPSVTRFGDKAFYACSNLSTTYYTGTIEQWINIDFEGYGNPTVYTTSLYINGEEIVDLVIPEGVTEIKACAFDTYRRLHSVTLPSTLTTLGSIVFKYCTGLVSITSNAIVPPSTNQSFQEVYTTTPVIVPCGCVAAYQAADGWSSFTNIQEAADCSYTVTVTANNDAYGTVSGGGTYAAGETATLIATPNCGCWFTHWEDQYGNVLGAGTLTITVNSDATYTAVFEAVPTTNIQLQCSTGQTLVYSLDCNNSTATLTGYVGTPTGALEIPSIISYYGRSYDVTHIDDLVFYVCRQITSVTIPNSVTTIGSQAFLYCDGLTSLYIPASVNEIGNYAFVGCGHLETIVVSENNMVYDSRNNCNALIHTQSNTLLEGCCNTVIPNDVVMLDYGAFESSTLHSIVIPNSVVDMERYVFSRCDNLTSIVVADGNPVFDSRDNCNAIIRTSTNTLVSGCKNTVIPNTVTTIGESAFAFCNAMTTVTIPSSVTSIAHEGFRECRNLTSITCLATTPPTLDQESFYQSPMNIPVYVPCGSLASYQAAQWWSDFTNIQDDCGTHTEEVNIRTCTGQTLRYEVNNRTHTATVIGYVGQCTGGLTIPAWFSIDDVRYTVTAIGPRAFENCRGLESVTLPVTITLIDEEAFKGCSALIEVDMK